MSNHPPQVTNDHWTLLYRFAPEIARAGLLEQIESYAQRIHIVNEELTKVEGMSQEDALALREYYGAAIPLDFSDLVVRASDIGLDVDWVKERCMEQGAVFDYKDLSMEIRWNYAHVLQVSERLAKEEAKWEAALEKGKTKEQAKKEVQKEATPPKSSRRTSKSKDTAKSKESQESESECGITSPAAEDSSTISKESSAGATVITEEHLHLLGFTAHVIECDLQLTLAQMQAPTMIFSAIKQFAERHGIADRVFAHYQILGKNDEERMTHKNLGILFQKLRSLIPTDVTPVPKPQLPTPTTTCESSSSSGSTAMTTTDDEPDITPFLAPIALNLPKPNWLVEAGMMIENNAKPERFRHADDVGWTVVTCDKLLELLDVAYKAQQKALKALYEKHKRDLEEVKSKMMFCYWGNLKGWLIDKVGKLDENGMMTFPGAKSVALEHAIVGLKAIPDSYHVDEEALDAWMKAMGDDEREFWGVKTIYDVNKKDLIELKRTKDPKDKDGNSLLPFITLKKGDPIGELYVSLPKEK